MLLKVKSHLRLQTSLLIAQFIILWFIAITACITWMVIIIGEKTHQSACNHYFSDLEVALFSPSNMQPHKEREEASALWTHFIVPKPEERRVTGRSSCFQKPRFKRKHFLPILPLSNPQPWSGSVGADLQPQLLTERHLRSLPSSAFCLAHLCSSRPAAQEWRRKRRWRRRRRRRRRRGRKRSGVYLTPAARRSSPDRPPSEFHFTRRFVRCERDTLWKLFRIQLNAGENIFLFAGL